MNLDNKEDLRLLDHLNKCRCCFEKYNYNENQMEITDIIKEQFLELTQIELKSSPSYSKSVCIKCTNELQSISNFRLDLITKQQKLYDFVTTSEYKIQDNVKFELVNVKIETQSSDELVNIFKLENQYEEIKKSEVPVTEADYQSPRKQRSLRRTKYIKPKVKTKVQKKALTKIKTKVEKVQPKVQKKVEPKEPEKRQVPNKVECPHCGILILSSYLLTIHIRRVHLKEKNFFCDLCDYGSFIKIDIQQHLSTHVPKLFREKLHCSMCKYVSICKQRLQAHIRSYHRNEELKTHICSICDRDFTYRVNLEKHMKTHNKKPQVKTTVKKKPDSIKQICPHCGIILINSDGLSVHIRRIHLKERKFSCDLCKYNAFNKIEIADHISTHLPLELREKLHCSKCNFMTITPQRMRSHVKRNCNLIKERVVCYCGKTFSSKVGLSNHEKYTHKKIKNKICPVCDKAFANTSHLKAHMAIHAENRVAV